MKEYATTKIEKFSHSQGVLLLRKRVENRLCHCLRYPATLIQAPHGYGKTTAVRQFICSGAYEHAYVQLSSENHPKAFFSCMKDMICSLLDQIPQIEGPEEVQIRFLMHLLAHTDTELFLIFDGVQVLQNKQITAFFAFLGKNLPKSVHLILIGTDISVYPQEGIKGEAILKIDTETLALSEQECQELADINNTKLEYTTLKLIHDLTRGSVLLADSCLICDTNLEQERAEIKLKELQEYFQPIWEEIPRKVQSALYFVALLGQFSLDNQSLPFMHKIITNILVLVDKSLFVTIDANRTVAIHPLFRSFVLKQMRTKKSKKVDSAVEMALAYLLSMNERRDAIKMVLDLKHFSLAAELLDNFSAELLSNGYLDFVTFAIEELPNYCIEQYASLLLLQIINGIRKGWNAPQVVERIERIRSSRLRRKMQEIDLLSILEGIDLLFQGKFHHAQVLIGPLLDEATYLRPLISVFLSCLPFGNKEDQLQIYHTLQETLKTINIKQNDALSIVLLSQIGFVQLELLLFEQAEHSFDEALRLGEDGNGNWASSCSLALVGKGWLSLYNEQEDTALQCFSLALSLGKDHSFYLYLNAQLALIEFYIITNHQEQALRLIREATSKARQYDVTTIDDQCIDAMHASYLLWFDDLPQLKQWVDNQNSQTEQEIPFALYILQQRQILGYYRKAGQTEHADTLYAHLQQTLKEQHRHLQALILSVEQGCVDLSIYEQRDRQIKDQHIAVLQRLYGSKPLCKAATLTERELEVLRLIEKGFLNKEIAHLMHITERTVKWHATQIYEKLKVSSRMAAVAEARNMGILP